MSTLDKFNRNAEYQFPYGHDDYDYVTIRGGKYLAREIDILRQTVQELQEQIFKIEESKKN